MNKCNTCGGKMEMYYGPWCPVCDKPEIKSISTLNLVQALDHLEAIGNPGIKRRVWESLLDYIRNDTYFEYFLGDADTSPDLYLLKSHLGLGESIVFHVSW